MRRCRSLIVLGLALLSGCALHTKATRWHGHVGPDGKPVFALTSTYVGLNLGVLLPFVGNTAIDGMVDESTEWIRKHEGSHLRLVETESNNYWWAIPPVSWVVSPVLTSITFEYRPSPLALKLERERNGEVVPEEQEGAAQPPR